MKRRRIYYKKWNLKISRELRDIIHGYIMSDGYIRKEGNPSVDQGVDQKKWVMWLFNKFENLRATTLPREVIRKNKKNGKITKSLRFFTRNLLHGFYNIWYKPIDSGSNNPVKQQKRLPKNISCFFSPLFISVWYAGDGTKIQGSLGAKFEVTSWTEEERLCLKKLFKQKYGINTLINRAGQSKLGRTQWTLNINASEYPKFKALITQYDLIPTLFPYKLH
jgi:hypothetical protein